MSYAKKNNEEKCLKIAISKIKSQTGYSRQILEMLNGIDFSRNEKERPDFVRIYQPKDKNQKPIMLGIEHFRIDQLSFKNGGEKFTSRGIDMEKNVANLFNLTCSKIETGSFEEDDVVSKTVEIIVNHMKNSMLSSYYTFLNSFEYSIDKHLPSISVYQENLKNYSQGHYTTRLALLMEIHTELHGLFFNDRKGTRRQSEGLIPITEDMVKILEEKLRKQPIDYIILCIGETLYTDLVNVIVLKANNIRSQLSKRHIPIYHYLGSNIQSCTSPYTSVNIYPNINKHDDEYKITYKQYSIGISKERKLDMTFYALRRVLEYEKKGVPYITDVSVQYVKDLFGEYIVNWYYPKGEEKWVVRPNFSPYDKEQIIKKSNEFQQKWFSKFKEGNDDETTTIIK